jgi:hypothetical protein
MSLPLLSRLWSHARDALTRLRSSLLPLDTLDCKERRDLRRWLAALEGFVRRIVLIEALSFLDRASSDAHVVGASNNAGLKARGARRSKRTPRLRLWPRPVHTGPRVRQLGPPTSVREIWREQRRAAIIARLAGARGRRSKPSIVFADRIDALESILAAPLRAARRLARKLAQTPRLAIKLAAARIRSALGLDDDLLHEAQDAAWPPALALNSS